MLKVSIVDDNLEFVKIMFNKLQNSELDKFELVNVSSNGKEALDYILKNSIDLLLLDLQIPELTGLEILEKIKHIEQLPKIIIITGDPLLLQGVFNSNIPISNVFVKPFNIDDLINAFNNIIIEKKTKNKNSNLYEQIIQTLEKFNFNKGSIGYKYLIDCISIYMKSDNIMPDFKKYLYSEVAYKNKVKHSSRIQWAIEKTIYAMIKYTNTEIIKYFFPYNTPTPKTFIIVISNIINSKSKN